MTKKAASTYQPGVGKPHGHTDTGKPWWYLTDSPDETRRVLGPIPCMPALAAPGVPERELAGPTKPLTADDFAKMYERMNPKPYKP